MRFAGGLLIFIACFISCYNPRGHHGDQTVFRYNESAAITSLDPAFAKDQANIWACTQLYNGLVQLDSKLCVKPCIAKSWEILDSNKTYVFHLRNDVFFHENTFFRNNANSRCVTAADFVYSFNRLTDAKVASPGAWVMNSVIKNEALNDSTPRGIEAVNDSTVRIRLSNPFSPFLSILSMTYCSVVPHEVIEHYGTDFRDHPCGTGPFKFKMWKEGVKLILLKNENYFEKANGVTSKLPYLDAVEISFITDRQSAFIEFIKGNLDFLNSIDASYKDELLTRTGELQPKYKGRFKMETAPYLNTEHLDIPMDSNLAVMKSSPLNNLLIRQALNYGFNRNEMMRYLRNNIGMAGNFGFVPPGLPSFDSTTAFGYTYNPAKAASLLKSAGYPDGKGLPEIVLSTNASYLDLCEYIKTQWELLGFKIRIDVNQGAIQRKMMAEQKLALARASWIADYPDAENYLALFYSKNFTPAGPNYTHYYNARYDSLYEKSVTEVNDSARYKLYQAMDKLVMEDAPVIILYYDRVVRLMQNNIEGLNANGMNLLVLKSVRKK